MDGHEWVGLHEAEVGREERAARDRVLAEDPEARAEQALSEELRDLLGAELEGGPTLDEIRARAGDRGAGLRRGVGGGMLLAAAALLWVGWPATEGTRDKGLGPAGLSVALGAVAEGPEGVRPLASDAVVRADEQVVFWVDASGPGELVLREDGARIHPLSGTWTAVDGEQAPGGQTPLAWRAETAGTHRYTVELCAVDGPCVRDGLALEWPSR